MDVTGDATPLPGIGDDPVSLADQAVAGCKEGAPGHFVLNSDLGDHAIDARRPPQIIRAEPERRCPDAPPARLGRHVDRDVDGAAPGALGMLARLIAQECDPLAIGENEHRRQGGLAEIAIAKLEPEGVPDLGLVMVEHSQRVSIVAPRHHQVGVRLDRPAQFEGEQRLRHRDTPARAEPCPRASATSQFSGRRSAWTCPGEWTVRFPG